MGNYRVRLTEREGGLDRVYVGGVEFVRKGERDMTMKIANAGAVGEVHSIDVCQKFKTKEEAQEVLPLLLHAWRDTLWAHRKGGTYVIRCVAVDEESLEICVVYQSVQRGSVWVRKVSNWVEEVEGKPRFWRIDDVGPNER